MVNLITGHEKRNYPSNIGEISRIEIYLPDNSKRKKPSSDRHCSRLFIAMAALNKSRLTFPLPSN